MTNRNKQRVRVLGGALGLLVAVGVAIAANQYLDDWWHFDIDSAIEIEHDIGDGTTNAVPLKLILNRGAEQPNGTLTLQFRIEVADTAILDSAVLQTGHDADSDGVLEETEWTTVATATIVEAGGETIATSPTVTIENDLDGYRISYTRTGIGTTTETWVNNPALDLPAF